MVGLLVLFELVSGFLQPRIAGKIGYRGAPIGSDPSEGGYVAVWLIGAAFALLAALLAVAARRREA